MQIPVDVVFFEAEPGELEGSWDDLFTSRGMETARGPALREHPDGYIHWHDHYNISGKIPFLIHPEVLTSDEAIVAVFQLKCSSCQSFVKCFSHRSGGA